MNERTIVIGGTFFLFLVSTAIVTYEQIQIGNLKGELRHTRMLMKAGIRTPTKQSDSAEKPPVSFDSDTVTSALAIKDFSTLLPPMISQGHRLRLPDRSRVHFLGYHLVVFELEDENNHTVPALFNIEDPQTPATWQYLYAFVSR
ncbi:MAG: hypothetical protein ACP5OP_01375 [Leptospirillia bacterium]